MYFEDICSCEVTTLWQHINMYIIIIIIMLFDRVLFCCCDAVCSRVLWIGNVRHTSEIDLKAKLAQFGQASVSVSEVCFISAYNY